MDEYMKWDEEQKAFVLTPAGAAGLNSGKLRHKWEPIRLPGFGGMIIDARYMGIEPNPDYREECRATGVARNQG